MSLNFKNERISFLNIVNEDLPEVLDWYNRLDQYMFATGVDRYLTLDEMQKKINESAVSSYDFFVWVINEEGHKIGMLKGSMKYQDKDSLWINSIIIAPEYRRMGYGKVVIESLIDYTKKKFKLEKVLVSVINDNTGAIGFWNRMGFYFVKKLENHISLGGKFRDVVIMQKDNINYS
ncbi:MAG: N-acetyltransferase family protein [Deltaproteobacteria bacterium]